MARPLRLRLLAYVKNLHTCERSQIFMKRMLKPGADPALVWSRLVRGSSTDYGTRWYYAQYLIVRLGLQPKRKLCEACQQTKKLYTWFTTTNCWHPYYKDTKLLAKDFPWTVVKPVMLKKLREEGL